MQLPVRITWAITTLAVLSLLFPPLETADVPRKVVLVHVGCFNTDVLANSNNDEHFITKNNNDLLDWDFAIYTCLMNLKVYLEVKPADDSSRKFFSFFCGHDLFNKSTELNASACEPCYHHDNEPHDSLRFCGGVGASSLYKIRDERTKDQTMAATHYIITSQNQFVPLYITVTVLLVVVIVLDVFFYRKCRNGISRPILVEEDGHADVPEV